MLLQEQQRRQLRRSLAEWCRTVLEPVGETPARHHLLICRELEEIAAGRNDRLMILAPPGSAKSTYVSKLFVAWWFCRNPRSNVIAASHTSSLAMGFGRWVRNIVAEFASELGYTLSEDSKAADKWATDKSGEYIAAGVGMAITGRRADLAIIDDPHVDRKDADSDAGRDNVWSWYRSVLYTRLKPRGRIVLVQTRWHEDDLAGRLLRDMETHTGDNWRVLRLLAIAEEHDPIGRAPGEALWPEWEDRSMLLRKRGVVGEREWQAQFQQNPTPGEGILFEVNKLVGVPFPPALVVAEVRAYDLAATEQIGGRDPDYTVGIRLALLETGQFLIRRDITRLQGTPHDVEMAIRATAAADGYDVRIGLPRDPGQAGKWQVAHLKKVLAGYVVEDSPETGSKMTRAAPVAVQVSAGNMLYEHDPVMMHLLKAEMQAFPQGRHDDMVDALSRAFSMLITQFSGQGVMDLMRRNLEQQALTLEGRQPEPIVETSLVDYYREVRAGLDRSQSNRCCVCRQEITGDTRISDGQRDWHRECF